MMVTNQPVVKILLRCQNQKATDSESKKRLKRKSRDGIEMFRHGASYHFRSRPPSQLALSRNFIYGETAGQN